MFIFHSCVASYVRVNAARHHQPWKIQKNAIEYGSYLEATGNTAEECRSSKWRKKENWKQIHVAYWLLAGYRCSGPHGYSRRQSQRADTISREFFSSFIVFVVILNTQEYIHWHTVRIDHRWGEISNRIVKIYNNNCYLSFSFDSKRKASLNTREFAYIYYYYWRPEEDRAIESASHCRLEEMHWYLLSHLS